MNGQIILFVNSFTNLRYQLVLPEKIHYFSQKDEDAMRTTNNTNAGHFLFALATTVPSVFFGLTFVWLQGASPTNVSSVFLLVLFSLVSGYFMWVWHHDQLAHQKNFHQRKNLDDMNKLNGVSR